MCHLFFSPCPPLHDSIWPVSEENVRLRGGVRKRVCVCVLFCLFFCLKYVRMLVTRHLKKRRSRRLVIISETKCVHFPFSVNKRLSLRRVTPGEIVLCVRFFFKYAPSHANAASIFVFTVHPLIFPLCSVSFIHPLPPPPCLFSNLLLCLVPPTIPPSLSLFPSPSSILFFLMLHLCGLRLYLRRSLSAVL